MFPIHTIGSTPHGSSTISECLICATNVVGCHLISHTHNLLQPISSSERIYEACRTPAPRGSKHTHSVIQCSLKPQFQSGKDEGGTVDAHSTASTEINHTDTHSGQYKHRVGGKSVRIESEIPVAKGPPKFPCCCFVPYCATVARMQLLYECECTFTRAH